METNEIRKRLLSQVESIYMEIDGRKIEAITNAGKIFDKEVTNIFNFLDFVATSAGMANDLIEQIQSNEKEKNAKFDKPNQQNSFHNKWIGFSQLFLQMLICRLVDNYSSYLSDVIRETIPSKPEILKSGEQVKLDYILQFDTMPDFLTDLVERKVTNLSYGGFTEIEKWCFDKLGLQLVETEEERNNLIELIETRNLFVHNRGKIGNKYLKNVPNTTFILGKERLIYLDYLVDSITLVLGCGLKFDENISKKFNLSK
jgi:hypothetical protein